MKKNNKIKNVVAVLIAATMITSSLSSCKAFDFFGSSSDSTIDSSVESTDVNEVESESTVVDETESEPSDDSSTTTQTQKETERETTSKQTTTTTKKSIFDIFTPKTTTTKKTTTTTKAQTSATNNNGTTTSTTKATTTTTKATQAQKTDYEIKFSSNNGVVLTSYKTSSSLYNKWRNSDISAQGNLFGANNVLIKESYGTCSITCSNTSLNKSISIKSSNSSVLSVDEIANNNPDDGVVFKANGTGKATITASIPNNTKTFSFTVAVVSEEQVIKKYQKEAMRLINEYRSKASVDPLQADNGMKKTAETRAKECRQKFEDAMAAGQNEFTAEFAHTRPDGSTYAKAFPDKYLHGGWGVNENVGVGQPTPLRIAKSWYSSSGHRTTMLSTNYDRGYVGLSIADDGRFYWVLNVAGLSNATGYEVSEEDKAIEPVRD